LRKVFYVLTPTPLALLSRVNTLLKGELELPALMRRYDARSSASEEGTSPYFVQGSVAAEGSGGGQMKARNNLERASQQ
jgi:hypothetical protein